METVDTAQSPVPTLLLSAPKGFGKKSVLTLLFEDGAAVEVFLSGYMTRTLNLLREAWEMDLTEPKTARGRRSNGSIAKGYAVAAGFISPLEDDTIAKYYTRIQNAVSDALEAASRQPVRIILLSGGHGARLAGPIAVPVPPLVP